MEKVLVGLGVGLMLAFVVFFLVLAGTLIGMAAGWIVSLFFEETFLAVLAAFGVTGIKMWQFGGFLGFVSGLFRSPGSKSNE